MKKDKDKNYTVYVPQGARMNFSSDQEEIPEVEYAKRMMRFNRSAINKLQGKKPDEP